MSSGSDSGPNFVTRTAGVVNLPPPSNSAIRRDRNTIPVSIPKFSGVNFSMAPLETLWDETGSQKSKMAAAKTKLNVAQFLYTR